MLQRVKELYEGTRLDGVLLLSCQHLLADSKQMYQHLLSLGLKPENCVVVGKNYSTCTEIMQELVALGCVVASFSDEFEPLRSFDDWFAEKLTAFIRTEILRRDMKSYSKIIVLDDGGFMHLVVSGLCGDFANIVGIEQTSSGHHRIQASGVRFPFISVARSYHKLHYESPYIAMVGAERIMRSLSASGKKSPRTLVFGLGPIGRLIAGRLLLVEKMDGCVIDPKSEMIRREGRGDVASRGVFDLLREKHYLHPDELAKRIGEFDLLIGCTGTPVLAENQIDLLHPEAALISMSSSDREFPSLPFRRAGGAIHDDYLLHGRTLVNAGFPITFDGKRQAMPPEQIELTVSLLMIRLLHEVTDQEKRLALSAVVGQIHEMWKCQV